MSRLRALRIEWNGDSEETRELTVPCPRAGEPVRIERCLRCGLSPGFTIAGPQEAYVRCRAEPSGERAAGEK